VTPALAALIGICLISAMAGIYICRWRVQMALFVFICSLHGVAYSASKAHVVAFGKWTTVSWIPTGAMRDKVEDKPVALKGRPLLVDARIKEFTLGPAHDVTDRLFVVRRAFRVNDTLPQESAAPPRWQWQRGGWLLVDRVSGHVSPINLPEFDVFYSEANWHRDYAAYCGVSDDGTKVYAVVAQIGRRKAVLKKVLAGKSVAANETTGAAPDSACPLPAWQRSPIRVTFESAGASSEAGAVKQAFVIRGHVIDLMTEEEEDEEAAK
jgi:hypothetical protein